MGRDGALPSKFFGYLDPVRRTPNYNLYLTGSVIVLGGLTLSYQTGAELLNFGAFIAFMGVNLAALRHAWGKPGRDLRWLVGQVLPPLVGFLVCLYIWSSLRTGAKVAGAVWMLAGIVYFAWRTRGFKERLEIAEPSL
jgi:hypothetical protein